MSLAEILNIANIVIFVCSTLATIILIPQSFNQWRREKQFKVLPILLFSSSVVLISMIVLFLTKPDRFILWVIFGSIVIIGALIILIMYITGVNQRNRAFRNNIESQIQGNELHLSRLKQQIEDSYSPFAMQYLQCLRGDPQIFLMEWSMEELETLYVPSKVKKVAKPSPSRWWMQTEIPRFEEDTISPDEVLRKDSRCVFVGEPGSGKTTILKHLFIQALSEYTEKQSIATSSKQALERSSWCIPIYIKLYDFAQMKETNQSHLDDQNDAVKLLEYIAQQQARQYKLDKDSIIAYLHERLKMGNALVLLDGLDETYIGKGQDQAKASFSNAVRSIEQLVAAYTSACFVVTCRLSAYEWWTNSSRTPFAFQQYEVQPFDEKNIEQLVINYVKKMRHPALTADNFIKMLKDEDSNSEAFIRKNELWKLVQNPLLLTLTLDLYLDGSGLFSTGGQRGLSEIYHSLATELFQRWDDRRGIVRYRGMGNKSRLRVLEEVAWRCLVKNVTTCTDDELCSILQSFSHAKASEEIQRLSVDGLFQKKDDHWEFAYEIWRNYFAAYFVVEETRRQREWNNNNKEKLEELLHNQLEGDIFSAWREVAQLYCSYVDNASFYKDVVDLNKDDVDPDKDNVSPFLQRLLLSEKDPASGAEPLEEDLFIPNIVLAGRYAVASLQEKSPKYSRWRDDFMSRQLPNKLQTTAYSLIRGQLIGILLEYASIAKLPLSGVFRIHFLSHATVLQIIEEVKKLHFQKDLKEAVLSEKLRGLLEEPELSPSLLPNIINLLIELRDSKAILNLLNRLSLIDEKIVEILANFPFTDNSGADVVSRYDLRFLLKLLKPGRLGLYTAKIIGRLGEPSLANDLLNKYLPKLLSTDLELCWKVALAIGRLQNRDDAIIAGLQRLLKDYDKLRHDSLRLHIAAALLALGEWSVKDLFLELFDKVSPLSQDARQSILQALVEFHLKALIPDLLTLIAASLAPDNPQRDARCLERLEILKTIGELGPDATFTPQLLYFFSLNEVQQEEALCIQLLCLLADRKFASEQSAAVLGKMRQRKTRSTHVSRAICYTCYMQGDTSLLKNLVQCLVMPDSALFLRLNIAEHLITATTNSDRSDQYVGLLKQDRSLLVSLLDTFFALQDVAREDEQQQDVPYVFSDKYTENNFVLMNLKRLYYREEEPLCEYIGIILSQMGQASLNARSYVIKRVYERLSSYQEGDTRYYRSMARIIEDLATEDDYDIIHGLIQMLNELDQQWQSQLKTDKRDESVGERADALYEVLHAIKKKNPSLLLRRRKPDGEIYCPPSAPSERIRDYSMIQRR